MFTNFVSLLIFATSINKKCFIVSVLSSLSILMTKGEKRSDVSLMKNPYSTAETKRFGHVWSNAVAEGL